MSQEQATRLAELEAQVAALQRETAALAALVICITDTLTLLHPGSSLYQTKEQASYMLELSMEHYH